IYLNGSILGMKRVDIQKKFDEMVAFAEIEKFIDTPVKHYSSGMYVRLAFSVAAHLEPEILLVDEVVDVGDAAFQKKCLGKMGDVAQEGRTVLFVSHNMDAVLRLCRSVILLKDGGIYASGRTEHVISTYLREDFGTAAVRKWTEDSAPTNGVVRLLGVRAHDEEGNVTETLDISKPLRVTMDYEVLQPGHILTPSFNFFNDRGINMFDSHDTRPEWRKKTKASGRYSSTVLVPGNFLSEGTVIIGVGLVTPDPFVVHLHERDLISLR